MRHGTDRVEHTVGRHYVVVCRCGWTTNPQDEGRAMGALQRHVDHAELREALEAVFSNDRDRLDSATKLGRAMVVATRSER